jgi:hypothetical protein
MPVSAALHLVPEPDDEPTPPPAKAAGEQPPSGAAVVDLDALDEPGDADTPEPDDVDELDDEPGEYDEEPAPQRALAMPDLSPYTSLDWVPEVINAGAAAARRKREQGQLKRAAEKEARAARKEAGESSPLLVMAIDVVAGTVGMLRYGAAWLGGEGGPDSVSVPGRLGLTALAGYFYYRAVGTWPDLAVAALIAVWFAGALGLRHRARAEAVKKAAKKAGKGIAKRPGPPPAATPAAVLDEAADEGAEQAPVEAVDEAPKEDPLTALIRAEIGDENGVHLADLRPAMRAAFPHLSGASDEALREVLTEAGWDPSKKFRARGVAGRQGVHRKQLPPLPSPEGAPGALSGPALRGGDRPRPADSSKAESGGERPGEGRRGGGERDFDILPDPERGPSAWRIVHHGGDRSQ